jgi:hypothetical protein
VKFVPHEMKTSIIKVFSYLGKNPVGTLQNPYFAREQKFNNLTQLLFIIENLQNAISFPQKSMEWRTFNKSDNKQIIDQATGEAEDQDAKPLATFKINIFFRQNASWQGSVHWLEKSLETEFRSALELIFLIDNVLAANDS